MAIELLNTMLDAVNLCLRAIGREPVASIDTADLDAATAKDSIDQISIDLQSKNGGWWFNREANWKLQPNTSTGFVTVPNNTLSLLEARCQFYDQGNRLAVRGGKIYDTDNHTYDLRSITDRNGYVTCTLVLALSYEELPPQARSAVAWKARRLFGNDTVGDVRQNERDYEREVMAMQELERSETRNQRYNYLRDNADVNYRINRLTGGYRRY